jgi:transcriptional regulator with XRE-family HTH domain
MKQVELAEKLGISNSHLSEIESGKKEPTLSLLNEYARVFKLPMSSILFFSENLSAPKSRRKAQQAVSRSVLRMMEFIAERTKNSNAN